MSMHAPQFHVRSRQPADTAEIDALVAHCFPGAAQRRTAALLRGTSRPLPGLAFVARTADGALAGSVACHEVVFHPLSGAPRPLVLLGPLVVAPCMRGAGVGRALMQAAVAALDAAGLDALLIGDAPYYGRFGFSAAATGQWVLPGPVERDRLLLRARVPARLAQAARIMAAPVLANAA